MTEPELIESIAAYISTVQGWIGIYITVLTAYLVTAFVAGIDLTRSQVLIISTAFVVFALLCVFGAISASFRILEFTTELRDLNTDRNFAMRWWVIEAVRATLLVGVIVALKFMWDVRHPTQ